MERTSKSPTQRKGLNGQHDFPVVLVLNLQIGNFVALSGLSMTPRMWARGEGESLP